MAKILGVIGGALLVLLGVGIGTVYVLAQRVIDRTYEVPRTVVPVPTDTASLERGKHLARISGCFQCHGENLEGTVLFDKPGIARINAPNLTRIVKEYDDAQLERVIRHGIKSDGTSTWSMPSQMLSHLSDEDLGKIIAYLRSVPDRDGPMRDTTIRLLARIGIVAGQFKPMAMQVAPDTAPRTTPGAAAADDSSYGRYLVMATCTQCHGTDLKGSDFVSAPSLIVATAYSDEAFHQLMHKGVKVSGQTTGMMSDTSRARFAGFSEKEIGAVHTFLREFAATVTQ
jgi:cytochrome c553